MRNTLPIVSGFYISEATGIVNRRLTNMYPVYPTTEAATSGGLVRTPGIVEALDVGTEGVSRGVQVLDNIEYRVIGFRLYEIKEDNTFIDRGFISGDRDVSMATNGINIAIQDPDGDSYFYTPSTTTLEENNNPAFQSFGQARTVVHKDGYYVYTTDKIFFSGSFKTVNDGKDFNPLDFEDAEIVADDIVAAWVNKNQLYIMGELSGEVYQTVETEGFPFQRIPNAVIQKGCIAPNTLTDFDNGFLFMGGDDGEKPGIWKGVGSSFQKISDSSIDTLLHQYDAATIRKSRCWTYGEGGAYFAVFTFGDDTVVYDATASKLKGRPEWHARQTGIGNGEKFFRWRARHGTLVYGELRVGDDRSGKVGILDKDSFREYGEKIERLMPTIPYNDQLDPYFNQEMELFMKTGVGNDEVEDPQIRMEYSDNGGITFTPERWRSMGKKGERNKRVRWSRMGRIPKTRMVQYKVTDPVEVQVYGHYANSEGT